MPEQVKGNRVNRVKRVDGLVLACSHSNSDVYPLNFPLDRSLALFNTGPKLLERPPKQLLCHGGPAISFSRLVVQPTQIGFGDRRVWARHRFAI